MRALIVRRLCLVLLTIALCTAAQSASGWDAVFFSHWEQKDQDPADGLHDGLEDHLAQDADETEQGGIVELKDVREVEDLIILGAGPAGLTAAIYAARANLRPLLISMDSGQLSTTGAVENFPSCQTTATGETIIASFWQQAKRFGARSLIATVDKVELLTELYDNSVNIAGKVRLSSEGVLPFRALIVATGAQTKRLEGVPGEDKYYGKGVASCATCEGWFFKGRHVVVIGGGDTAMEEALFLSRICKSVTVIHRRSSFRASKVMAQRVQSHPSISIKWNSTISEFIGDGTKLTGVAISNEWTEYEEVVDAQGAFVAIGQKPNTDMFIGSTLELDSEGFITTGPGTATKTDGIFAAGDVADRVYRQAITSAGTGAMAALDSERYLCHLGC